MFLTAVTKLHRLGNNRHLAGGYRTAPTRRCGAGGRRSAAAIPYNSQRKVVLENPPVAAEIHGYG
jgi:hypothetical protein